jgi:HSP20 family protein
MRADAFRRGDAFVVNFDLPGVDPGSVEVTVEKNVLSVGAERHWSPEDGEQVVLAERPQGRFERKLYLSNNLNTEAIEARYDQGVLSLRIPVSEASKPRKVQVTSGDGREVIPAGSTPQS